MVWFDEPEPFPDTVLAALVEEETGGDLHASVRRAGEWPDDAERAAAQQRLKAARGRYMQRPDHLDDPEWSEIASTLATPREARFGHVSFPQHGVNYNALAAADSWFGLIAVNEEDAIYVRTFRKEPLADALVAGLAEFVQHCGEQPIRVPRRLLREIDHGLAGLRDPHPSVARLQRLMRLPIYLSCEFFAEFQRPGQPRRRSSAPLRVYGLGDERYDAGCWTLTTTDDEIIVAPADLEDLANRVEQLRRDLD